MGVAKMRLAVKSGLKLLTIALVMCGGELQGQTGHAWQIGPFTRPVSGNPIIAPRAESTFADPILKSPAHWEVLHTFNPAAIIRDGKVFVLYRAEDDSGAMEIGGHTSRLGLAQSTDGIHFTREDTPVFFPGNDAQQSREWPGGVEDPRIVEGEDGTYVLTYSQWNRKAFSVGVATSLDLRHWIKHGPAFLKAESGKYANVNYKSAGIVTWLNPAKGRLIAARINGKYWMYWGEGAVHLATSTDLIDWTPIENAQGAPIELLRPRAGSFDSTFPETGPPPILTDAGIVVLYNGRNAPSGGDTTLRPEAYAMGEALFDSHEPTHLLAQTSHPSLKPELAYEMTGQYKAGTTFAEGLVYFHDKWYLYYGCADSMVGVVTAPKQSQKEQNADPNKFASGRNYLNGVYSHPLEGSTPKLMGYPWDFTIGGSYQDHCAGCSVGGIAGLKGYPVILDLYHVQTGFPDFATAANGGYNANYKKTLEQLVPYASEIYAVRIDSEFNGDWEATTPFGKTTVSTDTWIAGFRNLALTVRKFLPSAKIIWNPNVGHFSPFPYYPGDDVVDLVGIDIYCFKKYHPTSAACWSDYLDHANGVNLTTIANFSRQHNKPIAIPEWGDTFGDGYMIGQMRTWMDNNDVVAHAYWDSGDDLEPDTSALPLLPVNQKAYVDAFGNRLYTGAYWPHLIPIKAGAVASVE